MNCSFRNVVRIGKLKLTTTEAHKNCGALLTVSKSKALTSACRLTHLLITLNRRLLTLGHLQNLLHQQNHLG